jgi:fluoroacetyl-CoA thioesterase
LREIPVGTKGSFSLMVESEHLANRFKDPLLPPVFAAPVMILAMENAAFDAVRPFLDPGETAVGTAVDIRQLAATPVGQQVTAEANVTKVDGRRIEFAVRARDEVEEIGHGKHERAIVDLGRVIERLERKNARRVVG